MKFFLIVSTLVFLSTSISPSYASGCDSAIHTNTDEESAEQYFDQMNLNNDQAVDRMEFKKSQLSKILKSFDKLNPDENGMVSKNLFIKFFVKVHSEPVTKL